VKVERWITPLLIEVRMTGGLRSFMAKMEREIYRQAHKAWPVGTEAARALGISPWAYRKRLDALGIRPRQRRQKKGE